MGKGGGDSQVPPSMMILFAGGECDVGEYGLRVLERMDVVSAKINCTTWDLSVSAILQRPRKSAY